MRVQWHHRLAGAAIAFILSLAPQLARGQNPPPDLSQLTLEELMSVKVTSVSKKEQALTAAPAAIYVISQEDIRRSGMTTLPEVLRLAPGVEVAQVASGIWAVSIRGDNTLFANKLLVLVDGRSVYSPSFSGVYWNEQDIPLEDIERIEIIRGPGATLWGANAVNGVINIITFPAAETQGALLSAGGGSHELFRGYARQGGKAGAAGSYRIYGLHARRQNLARWLAPDANDGWNATRGGFRSDWQLGPSDALTVQGDLMRAMPDAPLAGPAPDAPFPGYAAHQGGNLLVRWTRTVSPHSVVSLQGYVDVARQTYSGVMRLNHTTGDLDVQHNFSAGRHAMVWGGGMRVLRERSWGTMFLRFVPAMQTRYQENGFVQDEIQMGRATLTLGSKFEANTFTGVAVQPNVRLLLRLAPEAALWGAVSRAARTPSEVEAQAQFVLPGFANPWLPTPGIVVFSSNPRPRNEELLAYEIGIRLEPRRELRLDAAAFLNRYDHLVTLRPASLTPVLVAMLQNGGSGRAYGLEFSAMWMPANKMKFSGSYSWLRTSLRDPLGMPSFSKPGDNPQHQFQGHASFSLPKRLEADAGLYYVGRLPTQVAGQYARLDLRLGWHPGRQWEVSLVGQNLAQDRHAEFVTDIQAAPILVRRSVFAKLTYQFKD